MKIKLDENLPTLAATVLAGLGHDVDTVHDEGLQGTDDDSVWLAAQNAERFLITQDLDFSDLRRFAFARHCGLMILRLREPGRLALTNRIIDVFQAENTEEWAECFVIVTDHKIRVRHPAA